MSAYKPPMLFRGRISRTFSKTCVLPRLRESREALKPRWPGPPRCFHYGAIRDTELYRALAPSGGFRPGRAIRRQKWGF